MKANKVISENIKNVGKISLGTILGQVISIITLPIFTRIYGAEVIGNWALFNSIAIIINSFSDLGLTNAIMIEGNENEAQKIYKIVTTISFFISVVLGIYIYIYPNLFFKNININRIFMSLTIIILTFTLQQVQVCYTWLNRNKNYNILMKNPLVNNLTIAIIAIILGISGFKKYGYYIAIILGQIATLVNMKRFLPKGIFHFNLNEYKITINKHFKFVKYQMPSTILLQIKSQLPTILIKSFFGTEVLGYYSVCLRILNMPITFLAKSLGKVFFQQISELSQINGDVGNFALKSIQKAMKISFIPIVFMLSLGDIATIILFGYEYIISANILRIMTFYGFFLFLSMATNGIAIVLDKQKYMMISGILQIIGFSFGIWIGSSIFNSIYISVALLTITFIVIQIIYFSAIFKSVNINISKYIKPLMIEMLLIILIYLIIRFLMMMIGIVSTI